MPKPSRKRPTPKTSGSRGPEAADLLLEVGTEELPYHFIKPALEALAESATRLLKDSRLVHGRLCTMGTPRRVVLTVESVAGRQASAVVEAMGPSRGVAYDASGQPTKAALGFANSQGVPVGELETRATSKGEYVFAVKRDSGRPASAVLSDVLPQVITGLSFPKAMKWNDTGLRFARPIRWVLALHGDRTIPFRVGDLGSGNRSWGHRFLSSGQTLRRQGLKIQNLKSYLKVIQSQGVIVDPERRRAMILAQLASLAKSARGQVHRDEDLLEQAIFTVEYPQTLLGGFNPQYLTLPKEILITSMKEHQGFFSLVRTDGTLLPNFLAVSNMRLSNMRLIREGNERVLGARLADAKFFFDEDRKVTLAQRVDKLKTVTFHQKLGTMYQKTERVMALAAKLAEALGNPSLQDPARRAAQLSKADLLTGMVGEFPALQGIMGREYARHDGEPEAVCRAIGEQYLPHSMEGPVPDSDPGKILSLADRLDTLAGFFHVGLVPSGSEDPLGLRRHATAIVRVIVEGRLRLAMGDLLAQAKELVAGQGFRGAAPADAARGKAVSADPGEFLADRLRHYGRTLHGLRDDVMEAVLQSPGSGSLDLVDLLARMQALQAITARPEFDPLIIGFKRAHRLVEKEQWTGDTIDGALLQHPAESALKKVLDETRQVVPAAIDRGAYGEALDALVRMKPAIDEFFVGVLVNAEDPALRGNRLSLLRGVDRLFLSFADFSHILVPGG